MSPAHPYEGFEPTIAFEMAVTSIEHLSRARLFLLLYLHTYPGARVRDIARFAGRSLENAQGQLDTLIRSGFVVRVESPSKGGSVPRGRLFKTSMQGEAWLSAMFGSSLKQMEEALMAKLLLPARSPPPAGDGPGRESSPAAAPP